MTVKTNTHVGRHWRMLKAAIWGAAAGAYLMTSAETLAAGIDPLLADVAYGNDNPLLAYNVSDANYYSPGMQYIDLVDTAGWFVITSKWNSTNEGVLTKNGAVGEDREILRMPSVAGNDADLCLFWQGLEGREGTYVLSYEGEGTIKVKGDVNIISSAPGEIVFENLAGGNIAVLISSTDPNNTGNNLKNISLVREEHVELHEIGATFNPEWLDLIKDSRHIRFMDWMKTNGSQVVTWEDYQASGAASIEHMVQLANETGVDPWFTMPAMADDDFIRNFATYVRDNLDPDLQVRVEYSNELWNYAFSQTQWLLEQATEAWGSGGNVYAKTANYHTVKAVNVAQIWDDVFGDEADARVVNVIGSQSSATDSEVLLTAPLWKILDPENYVDPATVFDEVGVTTYFGAFAMSKVAARDQLIAKIKDPGVDAKAWFAEKLMDPTYGDSIPVKIDRLKATAAIVEKFGLEMVVYEGGQHVHHTFAVAGMAAEDKALLADFMTEFMESPEMGELYRELWEAWAEVGNNPFMQYLDIGAKNADGTFYLYSSLDDSTPRSEILEELNATTNPWWDAVGGVHYQDGVTQIGTAESEILAGSLQEDYLVGKGGDDVFVLGLGDDGAHGGDGHDVVVMRGSYADYEIVRDGDAVYVDGPEGFDTLIEVEEIHFASGEILNLATMALTYKEGAVQPAPAPAPVEVAEPVVPLATPEIHKKTAEVGTPEPEVPLVTVTEIGKVELGAATSGLRISGISVYSALGRELGLVSGGNDYVVYEEGTTATLDGQSTQANHWTMQEGKIGKDGTTVGGSALEVALKFGAVVVGADAAMKGSIYGDTYSGRSTDDHFDGGDGNDYISGRDGNDMLIGGKGDDKLLGGVGDDTLSGGAGNDMIDGGAGIDTLLLSGSLADYWVTEEENGDLILYGAEHTDTLRNMERVEFEDGTIVSTDDLVREADLLASIEMTEVTVSAQGDIVDAALNSDVRFTDMDRGLNIWGINKTSLLGRDVALGDNRGYVVQESDAAVQVADQTVSASYWSLQENTLSKGGEKLLTYVLDLTLQLGSVVTNVNGAVIGSDFADRFMGRNADDIFYGGDGKDLIYADYGDDTVSGGAGNDLIVGGHGRDTALFSGEAADYDVFSRAGNIYITGTDGRDQLSEIEILQFEDGSQYDLTTLIPDANDNDRISLADITPHAFADVSDLLFV